MKVVLFAFRPAPPLLSAALPLKVAGTVAARKVLPSAGVVTEVAVGGALSSVKVMALPVKVFPTLSVAFACKVYVLPSLSDPHAGIVALLVHAAAVLPVVALWVVARLATPACQAEPVQ